MDSNNLKSKVGHLAKTEKLSLIIANCRENWSKGNISLMDLGKTIKNT